MRDLIILVLHFIVTLAKLLRPGGVNAVMAESMLVKHQLQISNRSRHRAPNLISLDRVVLGLLSLFISPRRFAKNRRHHQIGYPASIPHRAGQAQISPALFISARWPASPDRKTPIPN